MTGIRISDEALRDLSDGFLFYEAQQRGLGDYFASCLRADIERLRVTVGIHRVVYRDYHRLLSRVFPYGIFYTVEGDWAVVWAVIDLRRDPIWKSVSAFALGSQAVLTTASTNGRLAVSAADCSAVRL